MYDEFDCPNCDGEGVIYDCQSDYACVDPESGCDLCIRKCDWCRPRTNQADQPSATFGGPSAAQPQSGDSVRTEE
jgi:hypothetical protein